MNIKLSFKHLYANDKLILFILISLYLILELINIKLPGLYADEAFTACGTLQILKNVGPCMPSIKIFNVFFPLMLAGYETAIESYILLPFFLLFGINAVALRLAPIIVGALGLILIYVFVKDFFDKKTALLTTILLITNPIFLLETKLGLNSASMLHFAAIGALLCLFKWFKGKNILYFLLGIFLLGLGLSIRVWFAWFIGGLLVCLVIFRKELVKRLKKRIWLCLVLGMFVFMLGSFLFVYYNILTRLSTVRFIIDSFNLTHTNINNLQYLKNLIRRIRVFTFLITGRCSFEEQGSWFSRSWSNPHPFTSIPVNHFLAWVFYFSTLWLSLSLVLKRFLFVKKRLISIIVLVLVILLLSPFTLSSLTGWHLFILYPFAMIVIAVAVVDLSKRSRYLRFFIPFIFLLIILTNIKIYIDWNRYFKQTGGIGNNSDAIYDLVAWLKEKKILKPLICDWGINHNIILLSEGKIIPVDLYAFVKSFPFGSGEEDVFFIENCKEFFMNKKNVYIFHAPESANMNRFEAFSKIAYEMNKYPVKEKIFYQRDGRPVYIIYSVR